MSLIFLTLPVEMRAVIERARVDIDAQDKQLAGEAGYASACDWSKAKAGTRPMDLHRIGRMSSAFQRAVIGRWTEALDLEAPLPPPVDLSRDRDLVRDLIAKLDQLLGRAKPLKAELVSEAERVSA
jgi:hypothetical protein